MWYVQLEGTLKHRDSDDEYDVQLDGVWRATGGMFAFGQDIAPSLTAEGLSREPWSRNFFKELQATVMLRILEAVDGQTWLKQNLKYYIQHDT